MLAEVIKIDAVEPVGNTLSVVRVGDDTIIANRLEDGSFRWAPSEYAVRIVENAIVPMDVLAEHGRYDEAKKKGDLGGSKGNRVKGRVFSITDDLKIDSRNILFKIEQSEPGVGPFMVKRGDTQRQVELGDDLTEFYGLTEYVPA